MSIAQTNTGAEFRDFISQNKVTVAQFHATWCGPCVRIGPYVQKKIKENGVALAKINVDINGQIAQKYNIQAMPTFIVVDNNGNALKQKHGGSQAVVNEIIAHAVNQLKKQ